MKSITYKHIEPDEKVYNIPKLEVGRGVSRFGLSHSLMFFKKFFRIFAELAGFN